MPDMTQAELAADERARLTTAYTELCKSYHRIDDFRSKLLGFLPLATGGIFLLAGEESMGPGANISGLGLCMNAPNANDLREIVNPLEHHGAALMHGLLRRFDDTAEFITRIKGGSKGPGWDQRGQGELFRREDRNDFMSAI